MHCTIFSGIGSKLKVGGVDSSEILTSRKRLWLWLCLTLQKSGSDAYDLYTSLLPIDAPCPSGWVPSPSEDDFSCYYISNTTQEVRATWYESRDLCQKLITNMDGYLLAINNQEELVRLNLYRLLVIDREDFVTYFFVFNDTLRRLNSSMVSFLKLSYNLTCSRRKLKERIDFIKTDCRVVF